MVHPCSPLALFRVRAGNSEAMNQALRGFTANEFERCVEILRRASQREAGWHEVDWASRTAVRLVRNVSTPLVDELVAAFEAALTSNELRLRPRLEALRSNLCLRLADYPGALANAES